jgi:autotransporter-associated beta strand protein
MRGIRRMGRRHGVRRRWVLSCAAAGVSLAGAARCMATLAADVTVMQVSATNDAYAIADINSCSVDLNNLITATVGGSTFQFAAYYDTSGDINIARRTPGTTTWTSVDTNINIVTPTDGNVTANSLLSDDHNTIAMAVDSTGHLNMSFGMHNVQLNYDISNASVMGTTSSFQSIAFTAQTPANAPTLFPNSGSGTVSDTTNEATYPDFYNIPGSSNLLFAYRNGGGGGGSGNGNEYFNTYNPNTNTWTNTFVIDGEQPSSTDPNSVNAYLNNLVYDSKGNLLMSWTWRATPNWQTNSNIDFAQSPDNGTTWFQQGGTTKYDLPITQLTTPAHPDPISVAQVIKAIPQNSSFINQTSMAVDANDNPFIATYFAPGKQTSPGVWTGTNANAPANVNTNNPNRQYMLVYYTGTQWETSQISNRTSDKSFDTGGGDVRDLGRPLVMVDKSNRVIVVTRSEDTNLGSYNKTTTPNNDFVVYWNTAASLDSASPMAWQTITLDTTNMGELEPTYDSAMWNSTNILDLMDEPTGFSGQTAGTLSVEEWNEPAYFASITPTSLTWDSNIGTSGAQDGSGTWDTTNLNFFGSGNNWAWNNSLGLGVTFGSANAAAGTVTLGANVTASNLTFNAASSGNYTIAGGGFTLTLASGATIAANVNAAISAPISSPGFIKTGIGTLTLSGSNSFAGALMIGTGAISGGNVNGVVKVTSSAAANGLTAVNLTDNNGAYAVFQIDGSGGNITLPNTLNFNMSGTTGSNLTSNMIESIAGNNVINGTISAVSGGTQYAVQVDGGTLTMSGNYNIGTLSSRVMDLQGAGSGTWSGVLANATSGGGLLGINKFGSGAWTLSNANTYTGATAVLAGTLNITGSIASTTVTVSGGGTLNAAGGSNDGLAVGTVLNVTGTAMFAAGIAGGGITPRTVSLMTITNGGLVQVVNPATHADRQVLITSLLSFAGGPTTWQGKLDLAGNDMIVHNASSTTAATELTNISSQLGQGETNDWQGTAGIVSTTAAGAGNTALAVELNNDGNGNTLVSSFDGQTVSNTDVLVKYTYFGDANLDGVVNGSDYTLIDNGFNSGESGWRNGDFNYDGVINGDDYMLIDNAFNTQGAVSLAGVSAAPPSPTEMVATDTEQVASSVPEPGSLGLVIVGAAILKRRRGRTGCNVHFDRAQCGQRPTSNVQL